MTLLSLAVVDQIFLGPVGALQIYLVLPYLLCVLADVHGWGGDDLPPIHLLNHVPKKDPSWDTGQISISNHPLKYIVTMNRHMEDGMTVYIL